MRECLILILLFLVPNAYAQEGIIIYNGHQTMEMSRELLLASLPKGLSADSAMAERILANIPGDGITTPINWETRFSGQKMIGKMNLADMMPDFGGSGTEAMTPFSGGQFPMGDMNTETYVDFEKGITITSVPFFTGGRYAISQDLDSTLLPEWELINRDSTIMGYDVRLALAEFNVAAVENALSLLPSAIAGEGVEMEIDSQRVEVWYAPALPTPAGPMMLGGLPGAVVYVSGELVLSGARLIWEISASTIDTTLDTPVVPPTGTPIEAEDYMEMMKLHLDTLMQQLQEIR